MSSAIPERRPSPLLSNNPFRNRAASPNNLQNPSSPSFKATASKNPFLDMTEQGPTTSSVNDRSSPSKPLFSGSAVELFVSVSLSIFFVCVCVCVCVWQG